MVGNLYVYMLRSITLCLLIGSSTILTSCASILNGRYQKVTADLSPGTTLFVDGEEATSGRTAEVKLRRNKQVKQLHTERPGYKNEYYVAYQQKRPLIYAMSWIPFIVVGAPFADYGDKAYNYAKSGQYSCEVALPVRATDQKYIFLKNTSFNLQKEDVEFVVRPKLLFGRHQRDIVTTGDEDVELDNTVFNETLNELLEEQGFANADAGLLKRKTNTMYISSKVNKLRFVRSNMVPVSYQHNAYVMHTELTIDFELTDIYGVTQTTKTVRSRSGDFSFNAHTGDNQRNVFLQATEDAIVAAFIEFMNDDRVGTLSKLGAEGEQAKEVMNILSSAQTTSADLNTSITATVTVKTEDGHGSGFAITNDGYLITNYHVIAGMDSIAIVNGDLELPAKVVRANTVEDLALLKVEHTFPHCFSLKDAAAYGVGQDVFAIGTPTAIDLGQTLTKGIISGIRDVEGTKLLQTDVAVNPGNSGGALVNKEGQLIGVVTSKISGLGVEGISFSIPAEFVKEGLNIE